MHFCKSLAILQNSASSNWGEFHVKVALLPQNKDFLIVPDLAAGHHLEIKFPEQARQYHPHLGICQTIRCLARASWTLLGTTYFLPMQLRGPNENGWRTALLS